MSQRKAGRPRNEVVTEYARALLNDPKQPLKQTEIATRMGVSRSIISQLASGRSGLGWDTAPAFAEAFGAAFWEFIRDAYEWDQQGRQLGQKEPVDVYPHRAVAIRRVGPEVAPEVIAAVREIPLRKDREDPPVAWWMRILLARQQEFEGTKPTTALLAADSVSHPSRR